MKKFFVVFSTASLCATLAFTGSCSCSSQLDTSDSQTTGQSTGGDINTSQNGGDLSSRGTSADGSTSQGGSSLTSTSQNEDEIWHHYPAVAPTATRHGSREFWEKGIEGSSAPCFEDPGVICVDNDFSEYESFFNLTSDDERYIAPGAATPTVNGSQITYGIYPQTVLEDSDGLYATLNANASQEAYRRYKYRGEYYYKITVYDDMYVTFDNGERIKYGTYWFKCEPIIWNILNINKGRYFILSSVVLDASAFYGHFDSKERTIDGKTVYQNNYKYSDIRTWLNTDFYCGAFRFGDAHIQTTTVNNSASTTEKNDNEYACENTQDKIYLPSYKDYVNSNYGFSKNVWDTKRECRTTDWARANDVDTSNNEYNGEYWTRSPDYYNPERIVSIGREGYIYGGGTYCDPDIGVRPCLTITIG